MDICTTNEEKKHISNYHDDESMAMAIHTVTPDVTMAGGCSSAPLMSSSKKSLSSAKSSSLPPLTSNVSMPQNLYLPALDHDDEARNESSSSSSNRGAEGDDDTLADSLFLPRSMSLLLPEDDPSQTSGSHRPYLQFVWEDTHDNQAALGSSSNDDDVFDSSMTSPIEQRRKDDEAKNKLPMRLRPVVHHASSSNQNRSSASSSSSFRSRLLQLPSCNSSSSGVLFHGHQQYASSSMGFKPLQSDEHIMQTTEEKQSRRPPLIPFASSSSHSARGFRSRQHTTSKEDKEITQRMSPTLLTSKRSRKASGLLKLTLKKQENNDSTSKENMNHLSSSSSYDFDNIDESASLTLPSPNTFSCQDSWPRQGTYYLSQRCHYFDPDEHHSCF